MFGDFDNTRAPNIWDFIWFNQQNHVKIDDSTNRIPTNMRNIWELNQQLKSYAHNFAFIIL